MSNKEIDCCLVIVKNRNSLISGVAEWAFLVDRIRFCSSLSVSVSVRPAQYLSVYVCVCLSVCHRRRLGLGFGEPKIVILLAYPEIFRAKFPTDLLRPKLQFFLNQNSRGSFSVISSLERTLPAKTQ